MANERYKIVPSSYLMLLRDGKILLARRFNTGFEDGNYGLVAGHGEQNENARETLIREAKEEAGIDIKLENIELAHVMHRKAALDERVDFFFEAKDYEGTPKIMEPEKCDEIQWFPLDNLPENTIDYIRQAIKNYRSGKFYSEYGWKR